MSDLTRKLRRTGEPIASSSRRETHRSGHISNPIPTSSSSNIKPRNASSSKFTSIPEPKSTSNAAYDDERTYNHFLALGMPSAITLEDFVQIMNRPTPEATGGGRRVHSGSGTQKPNDDGNTLRKALEFLSVHFVGREEARRVRASISRAREEHAQAKSARPQSRIKAPAVSHMAKGEDILDDPQAVAKSQRDAAYRSLESAQREYGAENARIGVLDKQKRDLTRQLEDKRRVELLLRVLEKRDVVRVARLGLGDGERRGMGALVRDLRKESSAAMREFQSIICEAALPIESFSRSPTAHSSRSAYKYTHTTNALANLYARHRRVVRRERESEAEHAGAGANAQEVAGDVEKRLEDVLRRLGVKDKAGLDKMKRTLVSVARRRAAARQHVKLLGNASVVDDTRLAELHRSNEEKRRKVQEKVNRAVALGWLCEGYIDLVSTFRSETVPSLNDALSEEGKRVEGYVDVLRTDILSLTQKPEAAFARKVREVMGTTRVAVWDEVRETFGKVGASERLVASGDLAVLPERGTEQHEVRVDAARNAKMLERKMTKADYGFGMADEIYERCWRTPKDSSNICN